MAPPRKDPSLLWVRPSRQPARTRPPAPALPGPHTGGPPASPPRWPWGGTMGPCVMTAPYRPLWSTHTCAQGGRDCVPSTEEETEAQTGVVTCLEPPSPQAGPQLSPQTCLSPPASLRDPPPGAAAEWPHRGERCENGHATRGWVWGSPGTEPAHSVAQKAGCPPHSDMGSHLPEPQGLLRILLWHIDHTDHAYEYAHTCARTCTQHVHACTAHVTHHISV